MKSPFHSPKHPQTSAPKPEVRVRPVLEREVEHGREPRKSGLGWRLCERERVEALEFRIVQTVRL